MVPPTQIDLAEALERDEIVPYFQPLVELHTGKLVGFEVLSRWNHPALGMIPPDKFIPLAEETGLISSLTEKILRKAFAVGLSIPRPLSLSVNISPIQFRDHNLPRLIEQAATDGKFAFHRLILEITESALVDNMQQARSISLGLKELGIRLALDDFGTGYSSLHHLQSLPFDELKIDASFVRSMDRTRESRKIAAAVIGLGHSLGLITVAEGIETRAQAEMLLWLGCERGQGWLFGRPVPAEEIPGILCRENLSPAEDSPSESAFASITAGMEALPALHLGQLQAIYDAAPVGLCFLDASLRYMSINKRLAKMNGASVAFHIGRHVQDLHPLLFKNVESYIRRALEGESLSGIEVTAPNLEPDSRPRTLLLSYEPVWDEADEVVGVVVAVVDITSRKVAEEALKDSQDHHRHSVELNPQIPWIMDVEGGSVEISPRWGQITGVTAEEALNRGWLKAVHPDDIERTLSVMRTALKTGDPIDMEYRLKYAGGEWHWMRSRGSPLRDASGSIVRWYGSVEDIDDRKKMEQALIESEAMLKAVFAAAPVGIVIAEAANGRIVMSNPQAETIFKRPRHSSDTIADYRKSGAYDTAGRLLEASDYPLAKAIETGKPTGPLELLYRRVDGSSAWIRASAAPLRNPHGEIIGGVVALLDIDDLKREKQVLVDRISELERQLGEIRDSSDSASLRSQ